MNHPRLALVFAFIALAAAGCNAKSEPAAGSEPKPDPDGSKAAAAPAKAAGAENGAAQQPAPAPAPAPANVDPGALGPDGLPMDLPATTSAAPSVAEWNAVTKEVTVKGSSALGCETKMVREWLRVSCREKGSLKPANVKTETSGGQQAFVGMFGTTASVVVQVLKGKDYIAEFTWNDKGEASTADLHVDWPSDHPRPVITLTKN